MSFLFLDCYWSYLKSDYEHYHGHDGQPVREKGTDEWGREVTYDANEPEGIDLRAMTEEKRAKMIGLELHVREHTNLVKRRSWDWIYFFSFLFFFSLLYIRVSLLFASPTYSSLWPLFY